MTMVPLPYIKGSLDALPCFHLCCLTLYESNSACFGPQATVFMGQTLAITYISGSRCYVGAGCFTKLLTLFGIMPKGIRYGRWFSDKL